MDALNSMKIPGKLPEEGHILWCYFPYTTFGGNNPKHADRHPVLVLAVASNDEGDDYLIVAGGTSLFDKSGIRRKTMATDLVVLKSFAGGAYKKHGPSDQLASDTKFSFLCKDVLALPYTQRWFFTPPNCSSPRIGFVDLTHADISSAYSRVQKSANLMETLNALCSNI